jgi:hypothetical protein
MRFWQIRSKHPELVMLKQQPAKFRLYARRVRYDRHSSLYSRERDNAILRTLESFDAITPLRPGEKEH